MPVTNDKLAEEVGCHNPSPLEWLIGHSNETSVVVEGIEMTALVVTGSQVSTLTEGFCLEVG